MTSSRLRFGRRVLPSMAVLLAGASAASGQALTFTQVASIPGPVDLVRAEGHVVYVVEGKTFAAFDVSRADAPKRVGEYVFGEQIWGFRLAGGRAYVANGHSGLGVLDISNPAAPRLVAQVKTPGQAKNVSVAGNRVFVANHMSGVDVIDLTNASKPALLGSAYVDGYARDVAAAGQVAVAVDNPSGVYVFDTAATNVVDPLASVQFATAPQQVELAEITGAAGAPRRLAVLAGSEPYDPLRAVKQQAGAKPRGGAIQFVDVTNPASPAMAGSYPTAGSGRRLAIKGAFVYLADGTDGLQVIDISDPAKAASVGRFKTAKTARDIAISNGLVFLVVGGRRPDGTGDDSEVVILRQTP